MSILRKHPPTSLTLTPETKCQIFFAYAKIILELKQLTTFIECFMYSCAHDCGPPNIHRNSYNSSFSAFSHWMFFGSQTLQLGWSLNCKQYKTCIYYLWSFDLWWILKSLFSSYTYSIFGHSWEPQTIKNS